MAIKHISLQPHHDVAFTLTKIAIPKPPAHVSVSRGLQIWPKPPGVRFSPVGGASVAAAAQCSAGSSGRWTCDTPARSLPA